MNRQQARPQPTTPNLMTSPGGANHNANGPSPDLFKPPMRSLSHPGDFTRLTPPAGTTSPSLSGQLTPIQRTCKSVRASREVNKYLNLSTFDNFVLYWANGSVCHANGQPCTATGTASTTVDTARFKVSKTKDSYGSL